MRNTNAKIALNNQVKISQVAAVLMALLLVVPYSTGAICYGFKEGYFPIQPRFYLLGVVALLAIHAFISRLRTNVIVVALLALFILRIADAFFLHRVPNLNNQETLSDEGAALAYCMGIIFLCSDRITLRYSVLLCGIATILTCTGVNAWERQNPLFFSSQEGRSAGMLINPNDSAAAIVAMLGLILSMSPPLWLAAGLICSSGIGVYLTLSRGGAIVWLLVTVAYAVFIAQSGLRRIVQFTILIVLIVLFILKAVDFEDPMIGGRTNAVASDDSRRERQLLGLEAMDVSDDPRIDLLFQGLNGVQQQPILGYGTGASLGLYQPHNQFIAVWLDNGIVGIAAFSLSLCLLIWTCISNNKVLLIGCIPLVVLIPFSQNLLENKSYLFTWIVLAGIVQMQRDTESSVVFGVDPRRL